MNVRDVMQLDAADVIMAGMGRLMLYQSGGTGQPVQVRAAVLNTPPRPGMLQAGTFAARGAQTLGETLMVMVVAADLSNGLATGDTLAEMAGGVRYRVTGTPFRPQGSGHWQAEVGRLQ